MNSITITIANADELIQAFSDALKPALIEALGLLKLEQEPSKKSVPERAKKKTAKATDNTLEVQQLSIADLEAIQEKESKEVALEAPPVSLDDLRVLAATIIKAKGREPVLKALESLGVTQLSKVQVQDYGKLKEMLEALNG